MIKPLHLIPGDKVAIVSLSKGMLGEEKFIHILDIACVRLECNFGLSVEVMPNALKGIEYLYDHPEARAADLMSAFRDPSVKAVINVIGGDDTIRLLPYIDFDVIRNNPKIFMGFSDTTVNHFMMYKAGLTSYYGGSLMNCWGEYVDINPYTESALRKAFFEPCERFEILPADYECFDDDQKVWWGVENMNVRRERLPAKGYEVLQGKGKASGRLLGGCIETFVDLIGTPLWPSLEDWRGKILFIETSDAERGNEYPESLFVWILRNLAAQGILNIINGIVMGKPPLREKYGDYKQLLTDVVSNESGRRDIPIFYNVNFGHAYPIGIIPYGLMCELDCDKMTIVVTESLTE